MIYRTVAALIVCFWILMTTLLIQNEVNPEDSRVREVPLTNVLKLLYLHEQASDLKIYAGGTPIGHLRVHPHNEKNTTDRIMEFTGTIQLSVPDRRRISWDGTVRLSRDYEMRQADWGVTLHDPGFMRLEVQAKADLPTVHVTVKTKERVVQEADVAMNESGIADLAQQFGAGAEVLTMMRQARTQVETQAKPTIRARQSSIRYRGERTETYLVSIEQNGQTLIHCHFSQLGQVLQANTVLGYTLQPDDLLP